MSSQEKRTYRWFSQRWLFDHALNAVGVEPFTGGSLTRGYEAIGIDILEVAHELKTRVRKFSDITRECKKIASSRESFAAEAAALGHGVTARENYFVASILYGCARWPIWEDAAPELHELTEKITACYQQYAKLSDHPIKRVEFPFEGKKLYAYFHLPSTEAERSTPPPCVLVIPGMDTFKEELVRLYGDKFLARGFAVLVLDGPGQGESLAAGLKLTPDNFDRAGKAALDHVLQLGVDKQQLGIYAASFGSYWGPRIMACDSRYVAGTFTNICHEAHGDTIFNGTLPSFKARHMWMTGIDDEEAFDQEYRPKLTLEGVGKKLAQPAIFIAAGSEDPLSPIEHTYHFFKEIASPRKKLLVYEGEEHRISDPLLPSRLGDFMQDAFLKKELAGGAYFLERGSGWRSMKTMQL